MMREEDEEVESKQLEKFLDRLLDELLRSVSSHGCWCCPP